MLERLGQNDIVRATTLLPTMWLNMVEFRSESSEISWQKRRKNYKVWQLTIDVLPLKAIRRVAIANVKCFWDLGRQRPNFDGYIYIQYAAPTYSARTSAIYFLPLMATVCWVRFPRATRGKHNAEFTKVGWELWYYFKPCVDQSS